MSFHLRCHDLEPCLLFWHQIGQMVQHTRDFDSNLESLCNDLLKYCSRLPGLDEQVLKQLRWTTRTELARAEVNRLFGWFLFFDSVETKKEAMAVSCVLQSAITCLSVVEVQQHDTKKTKTDGENSLMDVPTSREKWQDEIVLCLSEDSDRSRILGVLVCYYLVTRLPIVTSRDDELQNKVSTLIRSSQTQQKAYFLAHTQSLLLDTKRHSVALTFLHTLGEWSPVYFPMERKGLSMKKKAIL